MKTYSTTQIQPKSKYYAKYHQSDIFIQKGLNKPEIQYTHKKIIPKNTFDSTYNFLDWKEMSPHMDKNIKVKLNLNNISQILHSNTEKYLKQNLDKIGSHKRHKTFYEKMHEKEPEKTIDNTALNKNINKRYQKETMNLGDYKGDEYKIKKSKSVIYTPSMEYMKRSNPFELRMNILYGSSEDIIGDYKPKINGKNKLVNSYSSIGYLKREFETNNDRNIKIINDPKKMKYFNVYGNKGIENADKHLKSLTISRSTNNIYTPGIDCTKNRINFLRSNIFDDKEIDKKNNDDKNIKINKAKNKDNDNIKVNRHIQKRKMTKKSNSTSNLIDKYYNKTINYSNKDININNNTHITDNYDLKNNSRKFLFNTKGEDNLPIKLDWRDPKVYLLFPQNKNRDILNKNSRQRKFKNLYDTDPILPKKKLGEEFKSDQRKEIENITKSNYKDNNNYPKIRKICDNIAQYQIQDNKNSNLLYPHGNNNINDIRTKTYEIIQMKKKDNNIINIEQLKKKFAEKGVHIYDIQENMNSVMHNKNMNKIDFKIREKKNKDKEKIEQIKTDLIKDNIVMKEKIEIRKDNKNNDIMSKHLNWDNPHCDLLTKNKKFNNTSNDGIHIKKKNNNHEGEKISKIVVNLKYKNGNVNKRH